MKIRLIVVVVFICVWCITESQKSTLMTDITNAGCGTSKLCLWSVYNCDLSGNPDCFFGSIQINNQNLFVELSGTTSTFVGLGLTATNQPWASTLVLTCVRDSTDAVLFTPTVLSGTALNLTDLTTINSTQGVYKNNPDRIQCTFSISTSLTINGNNNLTVNNATPFYVTLLKGVTGANLSASNTVFTYSAPLILTDKTLNIASNKTSVTPLSFSGAGCGTSKLCVANPSACEPAGASCFFVSSSLMNQILYFELSGRTSGYVALGLTKQGSTYVFVCGNYNNYGAFFFKTATQSGAALNLANVTSVYYAQGEVTQSQTLIQCVFTTSRIFNIGAKASDTSYIVSILTGAVSSGSQLGNAETKFISSAPLDLTDPKALMNLLAQTTATTTPANSSSSIISLWTHVLAVLHSVMSLYFITSPSL